MTRQITSSEWKMPRNNLPPSCAKRCKLRATSLAFWSVNSTPAIGGKPTSLDGVRLRSHKTKLSAYADTSMEALKSDLALDIKKIRKAQGVAQERLALDAEVDRTVVSKIERFVGNPSLTRCSS